MKHFFYLLISLFFSTIVLHAQDPSGVHFSYDIAPVPGQLTQVEVRIYAQTTDPGAVFEVSNFTGQILYNASAASTVSNTANFVNDEGWDGSQTTFSSQLSISQVIGGRTFTARRTIGSGDDESDHPFSTTITNVRKQIYTVVFNRIGLADGVSGGYFYMHLWQGFPSNYSNVNIADYFFTEYTYSTAVPIALGPTTTPVTLINFFAKNNNNQSANLSWTVTDEYDARHYVVERSYDGQKFTAIAQVPAQNKSELYTYTYEDNGMQLAAGSQTTVYYRLTLVDLDGTTKIHGIRQVKFSLPGNKVVVKVMPNPFMQAIQVNIPSDNNQKAKVQLTNTGGQVVYSQSHQLSKGGNQLIIEPKVALTNGIYTLTIVQDNGTTSIQKLVRGN